MLASGLNRKVKLQFEDVPMIKTAPPAAALPPIISHWIGSLSGLTLGFGPGTTQTESLPS